MKTHLLFSLIFATSVFTMQGQSKIVINDTDNLLNENAEALLTDNLKRNNLEYSTMMDFRVRCEYYMGSLIVRDNEAFITLMDCENKEAGTKSLGSGFLTAEDQEKAILLSFAIADIAKEPGRYVTEVTPIRMIRDDEAPEKSLEEAPVPGENEHTSRYFFAPSAYNLKQGELYLNTIYFLIYDIQYGISDNFSIGMGTTIAGFPFYLTPKITIQAGEKSTIAVGDMIILGTWGSDFFGNLLYGVYTHGSHENNVSVGAGLLSTNESDMTIRDNSLVLNFSWLARASDFVYLVNENYGFQVTSSREAYRYEELPTEPYWRDYYETYEQKQTIIYGLAGLRFINKTNDVVSWQFGLSYVLSFFSDIPDKYTYNNWSTYGQDGGSKFIAIPTVSFTKKFGKKF